MAGWIKMKLCMVVGLGIGQIVLNEDPAPLPQRGTPQLLAHVRCGQTAESIKVPLDREVGIGPGHTVLDAWGPTSPPERGTALQFSAHVYCGQTVVHLSYC